MAKNPTILHRLHQWAQDDGQAPAQRYKEGGDWQTITAQEYWDRVFSLALFLESKGYSSQDCGAILSYNSPEWVHTDLAFLLLRVKSAGLYPNSSEKDIHYVLNHTEARVLAVQNKDYYSKITESGKSVPSSVDMVLVFDGDTSVHPKAVAYRDAIEEGRRLMAGKSAQDYLGKLDPNEGAFLIYTSGTTGNPKGALLSHDNLCFTSDFVVDIWELQPRPGNNGSMFSFLPLCHIAEKLQNIGVGITGQFTVHFCSKFENLTIELPEVQPTVMLCVPRLWEKMMEGVKNKLAAASGLKPKLAKWAFGVGDRYYGAKARGETPALSDALQIILAEKIILSKVKHALGLAKAEKCASGAAALNATVATWFRGLGLEIQQAFGQTECTGILAMTVMNVDCVGTVGRAVPGTEFKIAEDGEVLTKGRHVFVGYYKNDEATRDTLKDNWLYTGDLAQFNDQNLLVVKGRKKEILKTSGGKMVAPLPIEEQIKIHSAVSQVCMVGDGRKYFTALITLAESLYENISKNGPTVSDQNVIAQVKGQIDSVNSELAGFEQVKSFTVLSEEFSIERGEMTPTLKMKRNIIEDHYRDVIDGMYGGK